MSGDLIPEEAADAAWIAVASVRDASPRRPDDADTGAVVAAALEAAVPLILAAELEQLAGELGKRDTIPNDEWDHGHQDGLETAAAALRARASVLRGAGDRK